MLKCETSTFWPTLKTILEYHKLHNITNVHHAVSNGDIYTTIDNCSIINYQCETDNMSFAEIYNLQTLMTMVLHMTMPT